MRWFERETLTARRQHLLHFRQRRARKHGDHQLGGLVADDARQPAYIERRAARRITVKMLGASAADIQGEFAVARLQYTMGQPLQSRSRRVHQNLGKSGKRSTPRCTCIFPYSAQRCSVGITLPGFNSPAGSKALLTAIICARSAAEN